MTLGRTVETSLTWLGRLTGSPTEGDWKQLLDVYGPLLRGWLSRSGAAAADHDDLIQDVLMVVVRRVSEFEVVAGRRAGKTTAMAALATYIATCCDHSDPLARGETGVLLCVAQDTRVAKKLLDFIEANLDGSEILRQLIKGRTVDSIELSSNIVVETRPASFRKLRGPTFIAIIADELGYWFSEDIYANPDVEVLAAARPGLLTTQGPLIMASSPYAKKGVLWDTYRQHYGPAGLPSVLVAKGTTRDFNATIAQEEIDRELARDPERNRAELLAEFRSDVAAFVDRQVVESCVGSYRELPPCGDITYKAFVDPSGGSQDSMTLAVAHKNDDTVIIDALREARPPFSPEAVTDEFAELLKTYRVSNVTGDRYGGEWPREQFRKRGIDYKLAELTKSDFYRDALALFNSGRIMLPRSDRLIAQIVGLERRVSRIGKDSIEHAPGGHDDLANCVCGVAAVTRTVGYVLDSAWISLDDEPKPAIPNWQRAGFTSQQEAEAYKQRARAQWGRAVTFPWDGYP